MPSRNIIKVYAPESYYHIFNRGVEKRKIFIDESDYAFFLGLFKRYLSSEEHHDIQARIYPHYRDQIELLAYCLMPNHFHILVYQVDEIAITKLVRSICTAYTMYFNRRYKRQGPLFQGRFKASMIASDSYLQHISRYIHLNPSDYLSWPFSSLQYYVGQKNPEWIGCERILEQFEHEDYMEFLKDYEDYQKSLKLIKSSLAV